MLMADRFCLPSPCTMATPPAQSSYRGIVPIALPAALLALRGSVVQRLRRVDLPVLQDGRDDGCRQLAHEQRRGASRTAS
jgi:hypothetical protein